jgi:hypothetical protein
MGVFKVYIRTSSRLGVNSNLKGNEKYDTWQSIVDQRLKVSALCLRFRLCQRTGGSFVPASTIKPAASRTKINLIAQAFSNIA